MKPAPFGYHLATSVDEAVELLAAYEGSARPLAGGQSLVPMLNMRLVRPDALVDLNGIRGLDTIEANGAETRLGALVAVYGARMVGRRRRRDCPLLTEVVRHVGDRQIRNRGTIGGSLSHGDPTGEMPLACLALGARVKVSGPAGGREIAVARPLPGVLRDRPRPARGAYRRRPARAPRATGPLPRCAGATTTLRS